MAGIPNVVVYIDDILVVGSSVDEHLQTLEAVFKRLEEAQLRFTLSKYYFLLKKVEYPGHQISGEDIQPTADKKRAILEAPTPQNLPQLRSFSGLLNYYGKFLPNITSILSPLYSLQKKACSLALEAVARRGVQRGKTPIDISESTDALCSQLQTCLVVRHLSVWVGGQSFHTSSSTVLNVPLLTRHTLWHQQKGSTRTVRWKRRG